MSVNTDISIVSFYCDFSIRTRTKCANDVVIRRSSYSIDVTPGDISMAYPHRVVTNILEGIEILDRVLPGLNSGSTLLYAPEIKLRGNRIKINRDMQTEIPNLFVAGDGAGASGNIVGAAISGIFAAEGLQHNLKTL